MELLLMGVERFNCLGVGGRIIPAWDSEPPPWFVSQGPYKLPAAIVYFDCGAEPCLLNTPPFGANMAFRREAFEKYGLFRTDLGPGVGSQIRGEDTEFCLRVMQAGERIAYAPDATVYHPVDPERMTKLYFLSWYFSYGRAQVRMANSSGDERRKVKVLWNRFREIVYYGRSSLVASDPPKRFWYLMNAFKTAGNLVESFDNKRTGKPSA
jgi:GT2 family glycosyltransferase